MVKLNGKRLTSFINGGGGSAYIGEPESAGIGGEIFELEHLEDGIVAFKSTKYNNVYLRADPQDLRPSWLKNGGGGVVNCQFSCGELERFCIQKAGDNGEVAIEMAEHPGVFLRAHTWTNTINLQGLRGDWERFFILIVG